MLGKNFKTIINNKSTNVKVVKLDKYPGVVWVRDEQNQIHIISVNDLNK